MTSLLSPGYSLTLGSQRWTEQLMRIELSLAAAPSLDALAVRLPAAAPLSANVGDPAALTLNSGETEQAVFAGTIAAVQRRFDGIDVTALNAGGDLAQYRPAVTYEQVTAGSVVRYLCGDAGADVGEVADGVSLLYYVADPSRTALDHIARVCGWSGAMARVSAENRLETIVVDATQAEVALKYGREIHALENRKLASPIRSFTVTGESGVGDTSSPDAFRPAVDFFAGNRPDGPNRQARWRSEPALRTSAAAATASAAHQRAYTSRRERGRFTAFLQPGLRPGTIVEVQSLPDGLPSEPLLVYRVQHTFGPRGAVTRADFSKGGDSFDPSSLLGSLLGAVGGLL
ncbi:MAG TPA: hypothetical protein VFZ25_03905 [Chloroflexota bacterium]|nr:hypothetical protein [Chloroflexota bacterium]